MFVAESGMLTFLASADTSSHEEPLESVPISSLGVRAVDLLLDPEAEIEIGEEAGGPADLIYVAAGRMGLWAMQVDATASSGPLFATRIDAGEIDGFSDRSWANALRLFEHDGTTYLAALFAHKLCSRVRLYELDELRTAADPSTGQYAETGTEVTPALDVGVGAACFYQTPRNESFAYGMAVDGDAIYVALGPYGVRRVLFTDPEELDEFQVSDGPYFGDGSYYEENVRASYGDYHLFERRDPPYVVDVAVERYGAETGYLWLAADNLGILRFDLSETWGSSMPIDHQEGRWATAHTGNDTRHEIRLVRLNPATNDLGGEPPTTTIKNYAHRLAIGETTRGLVLAVATSSRPLIFSDSILDEGRTLSHLGTGYQGTSQVLGMLLDEDDAQGSFLGGPTGPFEYTILYDLSTLEPQEPGPSVSGDHRHAKFVRHGGRHVYLPPAQEDGTLVALGSAYLSQSGALGFDSVHFSFRADWDWPASGSLGAPNDDPDELYGRERFYRAGRHSYEITFSPSRPELLHVGSNDAGFPPDGYLVLCNGEFVRYYDPPSSSPPGGPDVRGTYGTIFNPYSVWKAPLGQNEERRDFVFGVGKVTTTATPRWMLVHVEVGEDLCLPGTGSNMPPDRLKTIYVSDQLDNFGSPGRGFYNTSSGVQAAYDGHCLGQTGGKPLAFVGRCATPTGIWVLNRENLESTILDAGTADGFVITTQDTTLNVYHRELLTHPEFANAYYYSGGPPQGFLTTHGLQGRVITFAPQLAQIPAPAESEDLLHWVLVVPAGAVHFPPDAVTQVAEPLRPPQVYQDYYDHAMVRIFDVHDYDTVTLDTEEVPVYTLVGKRPQGTAFRIETLSWQDESYVFVGDFGGSVAIWKVTDLLQEPPGAFVQAEDVGTEYFFEEWLSPESISDDIFNNVWHIAVVPEEWHDGTALRKEVYVYTMVGRYGIAVLRFDPQADLGERLEEIATIRIPSGMGGIRLWDDGAGNRKLLVNESTNGPRVFGYPQ